MRHTGQSCALGCVLVFVAGLVSMAFYRGFLAVSGAASLALAVYALYRYVDGRRRSNAGQVGRFATVLVALCCLSAMNTIWLTAAAARAVYLLPSAQFLKFGDTWLQWSFYASLLFLLIGVVVWIDLGRRTTLGSSAVALTLTAIFGVLVSLAQPLEAREVVGYRKAECLMHVKQLTMAVQMYLSDNDGRFPDASRWSDSIAEPDREQFRCPEARELRCAYAYNESLSCVSASSLSEPANTIVLFESDRGWDAAGAAGILPDVPRHLSGDNLGLADGSARWAPRSPINPLDTRSGWRKAYPDQLHLRWKP